MDVTPSSKTLKQARLPFQLVRPTDSPQALKKRKLNDNSVDPSSVKGNENKDVSAVQNEKNVIPEPNLCKKDKYKQKLLKFKKDYIPGQIIEKKLNEKRDESSEKNNTLTIKEKAKSEETEGVVEMNDSNAIDLVSSSVESDNDTKSDQESGQEERQTSSAELKSQKEPMDSSMEVETKTPITKKPESDRSRKLTPKLLARRAEFEKKRQEKLAIKQEKEQKRLEEKEIREKQKLELLEQKKKEREEKEEKRKKEKEEKERQKNEEKKAKEDERKAKEEEKKRLDEQKLEEKKKKDEEVQKKMSKEAAAFTSFFKKVKPKRQDNAEVQTQQFMQFPVKPGMRLASINRNPLTPERRNLLDDYLVHQDADETYLFQLRCGEIIPGKSGNTWPLSEKYEVIEIPEEMDICVLNDKTEKKSNLPRPKLLQFHENRRPPYWGTFRKKSLSVKPRRPFGNDKVFDYEVDSDDEWEEEEPGESLHGSDDEKESEDDYDEDEFLVPHGYLSEEENQDEDALSPEAQKAKLKLLGEQFDAERKTNLKQLIPICIGCIWFNYDLHQPDGANSSVIRLLNARKAVLLGSQEPIITSSEDPEPSDSVPSSASKNAQKQTQFPEAAVPDLIRLLHGNCLSKHTLKVEFAEYWNRKEKSDSNEASPLYLSNICIVKKIQEISTYGDCPEEGPLFGKKCWHVKSELRELYGLNDIELPYKWEYLTRPKKLRKHGDSSPSGNNANVSLISKFDEEQKVQKPSMFPEAAVPDLIKLLHGNTLSKNTLKVEFSEYWYKKELSESTDSSSLQRLSYRSVLRKINEISCYGECREDGPMMNRTCWLVNEDVREKYGLQTLTLPNDWSYVTGIKKRKDPDHTDESAATPPSKKINVSLITKFTKVLTDEERKKQLAKAQLNNSVTEGSPVPNSPTVSSIMKFTKVLTEEEKKLQLVNKSSSSMSGPPKKKVCLLASVPRGQEISVSAAELLKKFRKVEPSSMTQSSQETVVEDTPSINGKTSKHFTSQFEESSLKASSSNLPKKRATLLMSVPRGQEINISAAQLNKKLKATPSDENQSIEIEVTDKMKEQSYSGGKTHIEEHNVTDNNVTADIIPPVSQNTALRNDSVAMEVD